MSFRILTSRQREQYGRFLGPPTPEQLEEYFRLDEADCRFARELRAFASQLCCAVQLGTLRFLGTFLPDPRSAPSTAVDFVAAQLRLSPLLLQRVEKPATWREQRRKIAQREGYRDFETVQSEFQDWLFQYLWLSSERLAVVFDRCTNWLAENQILLPPAETLESLIGATASRARDALSERLNEAAGGDLAERLQGLLERDGPHSGCPLAELRKAPRGVSTRVVRHALQRWQRLLALGANAPELKDVPFAKIQELARQAASVSPSTLERLPAARRTATLLAFARVFEVKALDDAMDHWTA